MAQAFSLWTDEHFIQSSDALHKLRCSHQQLRQWCNEMGIQLDRDLPLRIHDNRERRDILVSMIKPIGHTIHWRKQEQPAVQESE